jgi:hypothetical protein
MTNINYLLKKYEKPTRAEKTSPEYNKQQKLEENRKHRHLLLDQLLNEIPFQLHDAQITQIRRWIDLFNPYWKQFHRQSSNETILLAFIMIQRKQVNKRLEVERFSISNKYKLTNKKFEVIQNNLIFQLMKHTPLTYTLSKKYNHDILVKNGE